MKKTFTRSEHKYLVAFVSDLTPVLLTKDGSVIKFDGLHFKNQWKEFAKSQLDKTHRRDKDIIDFFKTQVGSQLIPELPELIKNKILASLISE